MPVAGMGTAPLINANSLRTMALQPLAGSAIVLMFLIKQHADGKRMRKCSLRPEMHVQGRSMRLAIGPQNGHKRHMLLPGVHVLYVVKCQLMPSDHKITHFNANCKGGLYPILPLVLEGGVVAGKEVASLGVVALCMRVSWGR